jgi:DNA-binding transcriptional MerR regulator
MRISQLSQRAGLPVGTVKFYLRTGLLHPGRATSATQAVYDESHLERLRLVRALLEIGGLTHAEIQRVLVILTTAPAEPLGAVEAFARATIPGPRDGDVDVTPARELAEDFGWQVDDDSPFLSDLARSLAALDALGVAPSRDRLRTYAEAASHAARSDVQAVTDADDDSRTLVAATSATLTDSLLGSLRQLAVENQVHRQRGRVPVQRISIPSA